uniref:Uncharacterized protein n=1 Tax=Panagrolaimus sp. PS1159 TaxID=55785 RepID=A0AC35GGG7_9BILA
MSTGYNNDNRLLCRINQLSIVDKNVVKSFGPHSPGAFKGSRLFGGHTITQSYLAFKKLYPKTQVVKLDTIFIAPGNVIDPMEFIIDEKTLEFGFTKMTIIQNTKLIANLMIRFTRNLSPELLIDPIQIKFPQNIGPPESYEALNISIVKNGLFELRPVLSHIKGEKRTESIDLTQSWCRLNSKLEIPKFDDSLAPLMLLTDYLVFRPVFNLLYHYEQTNESTFGSSLNHKILIHHSDVNQNEFFFVQLRTHIISKQRGMIDGQIFDEKHRCILTYRQENFVQ